MQKIPTIYLRNPETKLRYLLREPHPDCGWVFAGEGIATRKYDGTCMMYDGQVWWARREVKDGGARPPGFVAIETDWVTGKTVGWEPVEQSAFARYHAEALTYAGLNGPLVGWPTGTYELVGPKINGNPEGVAQHELWRHGDAETPALVPTGYDELAVFLRSFPGEGIVWHHPDGRMAKIKRKDFPQETP